jgi:hypothetical protein
MSAANYIFGDGPARSGDQERQLAFVRYAVFPSPGFAELAL